LKHNRELLPGHHPAEFVAVIIGGKIPKNIGLLFPKKIGVISPKSSE